MGRKARGKSERRDGRQAGQPGRPAAEEANARRGAGAALAVAGAVLLFVLVTVWAAPRPAVDTFMGLAGGRDVFAGKLGKPDDWSFTTAGRVWLNQNWGFDALMFAAFRAGGEGGLLALKALALLAIAAAAVAAARRRGAGWPSALVVVAAAMAGMRQYTELRANLATFAMACLLLLVIYESGRRPRLVWLAVPLIAVWANLHGGYTLGLMLLALWLAAGGVEALLRSGVRAALTWAWAPAAAAAASVGAVVALSPLGLANLTHPFTVLRSPEWRAVNEWHAPSFTPAAGTTSAWELVGMIVLVVAATAWRLLAHADVTDATASAGNGRLRLVLFDSGLVVLAASLGFSAVRFLPLSLVVLAPLAAAQAEVAFRGARPWLPAALGAVALGVGVAPFAGRVAATYSPANPRFTDESCFLRMCSIDTLPSGAADFLLDNDVGGHVLADWAWEGYVHWRCPRPRLFIGCRAQQIYTAETLRAYDEIPTSPRAADLLAQRDVRLMVVPLERQYLHLVDVLAFAPGTSWSVVFFDGRGAVLADLASAETRALAERVAAGRARFRSGPVGALSEALCTISSGAAVDMQAISRLAAANRALPTGAGPWFMLFAARAHRLAPRALVAAFEDEYAALSGGGGRGGPPIGTLQARLSIAQVLANLYGRGPQAARWTETREALLAELQRTVNNP